MTKYLIFFLVCFSMEPTFAQVLSLKQKAEITESYLITRTKNMGDNALKVNCDSISYALILMEARKFVLVSLKIDPANDVYTRAFENLLKNYKANKCELSSGANLPGQATRITITYNNGGAVFRRTVSAEEYLFSMLTEKQKNQFLQDLAPTSQKAFTDLESSEFLAEFKKHFVTEKTNEISDEQAWLHLATKNGIEKNEFEQLLKKFNNSLAVPESKPELDKFKLKLYNDVPKFNPAINDEVDH